MAEKNGNKTPFDIADHLPLRLIKSEIIPPAPNRPDPESGSKPAIDWLPDFAGYAWIAYGASSLLVISHLPNPLSETEPRIGPIFRQVLELSADGTGTVSAVSWSPATPSSGDLAAALDNCIGLFSYDPHTSNSSFCWSQTAILEQSTKVDAIEWTGSGDGIISGGVEVVLWRKKEMTWEIAWRFKPELPQILVSTSWSIEGPSATAPPSKLHSGGSSSLINEASKCVLVCQSVGDSIYIQAELRHPLPVSMIQWRPSTGKRSKKDAGHLLRLVLLTCCLDGAIRLWSEVDDGRRKAGKDNTDSKITRLSFRVVAAIEVNQALSGILGSDIFVRWASEIDAIVTIAKEAKHYSCSDDYLHDKAGRCEWLIGYGRESKATLWAIHCLDDFAPLRFPRVTLWKAQELTSSEVGTSRFLLDKVFIMRNQLSAPPKICSLVELLPCNTLSWLIYSPTSTSMRGGDPNICQTKNLLSSSVKEILDIDSHTGKILQVAVHPYLCEAELAASLDSDGTLLLWSLSSFSYSIMGMPTLTPSWKLSGKSNSSHSHSKYTSLRWAPAVLHEDSVLVMGHAAGIDCFIIKNVKSEGETFTHYNLCTIPFGSHGHGQAPTSVWTVPLPSTCDKTFVSNNFMLVAVWKNEFHALSWKISIHHCDSPGSSCACSFDVKNTVENNWYTFEGNYSDRRYYISVVPFSSVLPAPHNHDKVSSFAVLCPTNSIFSEEQKMSSANELYSNCPAYHMVTGCAGGSLKLWRSIPAEFGSSSSQWDLVGILAAHESPVLAISPSVCGKKVATVASVDFSNTSSILIIWECVNLAVAGGFVREDTLYFDGEIVALNWLMMGNGQLVLAVCLQNELHVYAQRNSRGLGTLTSEGSLEGSTWVCIAVSPTCSTILDFFWGPKAMPIVVHHEYFCLFNHLAFLGNKKHLPCKHSPLNYNQGSEKYTSPAVFPHPGISHFKDSSMKEHGRQYVSRPFMKMNVKNDIQSIMNVESSNKKNNSGSNKFLRSLTDVAEQLGGSLPVFHSEALLINICSGNWRRAYVALQHLAEHLASNDAFTNGCCYEKSNPFIPSVAISNYFDGTSPSYTSGNSFQWGGEVSLSAASSQFQQGSPQYSSSWGNSVSNNAYASSSRKYETLDFIDALEKLFQAAFVTLTEKMQIHAIIDLLQEISNQQISSAYGSLDEPGRRFWVSVRFQWLYFVQRCGRSPIAGELVVHSGLIGWAFHSDCQENLFNSLLSNEPSWEEMRDIGVGYWYTNAAQLRVKMEKLARRQYLKNKDPKACALLYIALNRLQVLAGLFKISKDEKDKPLVGFLSRNFQEEKNKAAALKNAYVLMGKHQLELAAAFFLLGGDTTSAVTVCAKNLGDVQLALIICHLVEGYGGPLEHHLVSKSLLPSALANDDYWLASLMEWIVGNHSQALLRMLGLKVESMSNKSTFSSSHASFLDPSIGQYCLMLATKTSMKNAIGEQSAAVLGRWSILMTATALRRWGLPLEALECLSSTLSIFGGLTQRSVTEIAGSLNDILKLLPCTNPSNWISGDVALNIESHAKSDLAVQYMSTLLKEHPSWLDPNIVSFGSCTYTDSKNEEFRRSLGNFQDRLTRALEYFQKKFSLNPLELVHKIVIYSCNYGLHSIGYDILHYYASENLPSEKSDGSGHFFLYPVPPKLLLKVTEEVSCMVSRYILACSVNCSYMKSWMASSLVGEEGSLCAVTWELYRWRLIWSLRFLRATLMMFSGACTTLFLNISFNILDIFEYYVYFAAAWSERNFEVLILIVRPLLTWVKENAPAETDLGYLSEILSEVAEMLARDSSLDDASSSIVTNEQMEHKEGGDISSSIEERWQLMAASLWGYVSTFLKHQLNSLLEKLEGGGSFQASCKLSSMSTSDMSEPGGKESHIGLISVIIGKLLDVTFAHISFHCAKQFVSYLLWKTDVASETILLCSNDSQSIPRAEINKYFTQGVESIDVLDDQKQLSASETLWNICANPKIIAGGLVQGNSELLQFIKQKSSKGWTDMYANIMGACEAEGIADKEDKHGSPSKGVGSPLACLSPNDHPFLNSGAKDTNETRKVAPFVNPKEIYKRNGELFEAFCINSIDQHEATLASNRKGLIFFKCEDGLPPSGDDSEFIWLDADWPRDGWAGSESTPIPTCVSPGVGLGSKKGTHLGLGGATVGAGSLVRPGGDLMGGGTFGVPRYAGVNTSNLGWGIQEEFDEFVDPPATLENVRTRALSAHPSRPLFLVGSSNTHVYLWEFGKDRATATYGVLPAANVPPPYALASISSVRFDLCGHRFVTGALDGTVCTWQLEVGGRSNIRPTESSVCFNNHTSDVSYVTASGSIIAAAGYSSNGVNVVVWDTLAPPATSRASIMCHEGGARSLAVFDKNIGSGSISPLIVTGGKDGDVGLHDFRYIATGRTKRHKHPDGGEQNSQASPIVDMRNKTGDQNRNGMLWYIPKAHSGSVTKISNIPNTSLFLTGSKDGDVKLWDAKQARLVFHWPRLHERHTFLQPSSRGFGGVVRAAVTDIQVVSSGFLTCGEDGSVKMIELKDVSFSNV